MGIRFNVFFLFSLFSINAQKITIKILDSLSNKPIPFASIIFSNNEGLISNEKGEFLLFDEHFRVNDSIIISYIGYEARKLNLDETINRVIRLKQKSIMLNEVIMTNKKYSAKEIIYLVKKNIILNYPDNYTHARLFHGINNFQKIKKLKINNFKSSIPKLNKSLIDSLLILLPMKNKNSMEVLTFFDKDLYNENHKINLIKARETYGKDDFIESFQKRIKKALEKNLKSDSYYKIKSGLFKRDIDLQSLEFNVDSTNSDFLKKKKHDAYKRDLKKKNEFAENRKKNLNFLYNTLFYKKNSDFNMIEKPNRYEFKLLEMSYLGNNLAYVISFKPKRNEKYYGTLYVNSNDYALMRFDFQNKESLFKFKLLGISVDNYKKSGRMIFYKTENRYLLRYLYVDSYTNIIFNRPLKFIEKNKNVQGRRKQNQISMDIDASFTNKSINEVRVLSEKIISKDSFNNIKEKNIVLPKFISEFKTDFWKGYESDKFIE